jgi:hypothetical protein
MTTIEEEEHNALYLFIAALFISYEEGGQQVMSETHIHQGFRTSIIAFLRGESSYNNLAFHMLLFNHGGIIPCILNLAIVFATPAEQVARDNIEQYINDLEEISSAQLEVDNLFIDQIRNMLIEVFAEDDDEEIPVRRRSLCVYHRK